MEEIYLRTVCLRGVQLTRCNAWRHVVIKLCPSEYNGVELNHSISRPSSPHPVFRRDTSTKGVTVANKTVEVVVVTDRSLWQQYDTKIEEVEEFALATIARLDEVWNFVV